MKFKYLIIFIFSIVFLSSCKSKKHVVHSQPKKIYPKVVQKNKDEVTKIEDKTSIKSTIFNSTEDYIAFFKDAAIEEMKIYKIPASITLAQGILESSSGNSELTKRSNNHFGIKCHKGWEGEQTLHDDDEKGECFRVYKDPTTSYRDHSLFLTSRSRYSKLFSLESGDYVGWAKGLSEAGYATDRRYPAKLIGLIEKFELHKYDTQVLGRKHIVEKSDITKNHNVQKGDTLYNISKRYGLSVDELKDINDLKSNEISIGQILIISK
ncbi:glucosaminidase domain-containing protein [Lutibacter sp.]|jgi:flagellum-specific peptidoglycan hydrolase FlgJ|uniref:glucosaminidase domain-containing protein n=1 Tax=Lutibacter sp. TaxID=1925666 RepID=UPI001A1FFE36|nr:glucosaminidase domain-containing protein [Lutibacter sp.]MBI9040509.1 glucosaminidase domain-containing protein [Lutibacter sp.]